MASTRVRGLDISSCQGHIDFAALPSWVRFMFVKVSEGFNGKDPARAANLAGARARGILTGVYHFSHLDADGHAQIQNLWDAIGDTMPLMIALDFEYLAKGLTVTQAVANLRDEADAVKDDFGRDGDIYTYPWFATSMGTALSSCTRLADCGLWMADLSKGEYPDDNAQPVVPKPWSKATFWQTSGDNSSRVPGIATPVDHDVFLGSEDDLRAHFGLPVLPEAA